MGTLPYVFLKLLFAIEVGHGFSSLIQPVAILKFASKDIHSFIFKHIDIFKT